MENVKNPQGVYFLPRIALSIWLYIHQLMQHGSTYNAFLPFKELLEEWKAPRINGATRKLKRVNKAIKNLADELEKTK